jgi:hypothetical protein
MFTVFVGAIHAEGPSSVPHFDALPGTAIGVIAFNTDQLASKEGRSGPSGAVTFVRGTGSFRWMYLPVKNDADAENLQFGIGERPATKKMFTNVRLATRDMVARLGLKEPFNLVEVQVNGGAGSSPEESFVATAIRRIDTTKEYPLAPDKVLREVLEIGNRRLAEQEPAIKKAFNKARTSINNASGVSGSDEKNKDVFVTWLPKKERLEINLIIRVSNGFYATSQGVDGPRFQSQRSGTQFGATFSVSFQVDRNGAIAAEIPMGIKPFIREIEPLR